MVSVIPVGPNRLKLLAWKAPLLLSILSSFDIFTTCFLVGYTTFYPPTRFLTRFAMNPQCVAFSVLHKIPVEQSVMSPLGAVLAQFLTGYFLHEFCVVVRLISSVHY